MSDELVLTPGGYRPKSSVHFVERGHVLRMVKGHAQEIDAAGNVFADYGLVPLHSGKAQHRPLSLTKAPGGRRAPKPRIFGSGWITWASWANNTGMPISKFSTTWVVPSAPLPQNNQSIDLFNGIQNTSMILQPVLDWSQQTGGGYSWNVWSGFIDGPGGSAFTNFSNATPVKAGDILTGVITLTNTTQTPNGPLYSYTCEFQGIPNTLLQIQTDDELTWCVETLECYGITQCSDYPLGYTKMTSIDIQTGVDAKGNPVYPATVWLPEDAVTDCGQQTVVVSDSNPNGEVDIYYHTPAPTVAAIGPPSVPTAGGTAVNIWGTGFVSGPGLAVTIGGALATGINWISTKSINLVTPAGKAGYQNVVVTNPDGQTGTLMDWLNYVPPPTIRNVSPSSGPVAGGTQIAINGKNFNTGWRRVTIGGRLPKLVTVKSDTQITATTPPGNPNLTLRSADVVVSTVGGSATLRGGFTYT